VFQIGDSLREARVRRGHSPADVHKAIRIRERYLTALEEERWDMLPGEAYTKGFLRTYAEYLGLNSQLYVDEYNARFSRHEDDAPALVPHAAAEKRRRPGRGILFALAAVLAVGAAVAGLAAWRLGGSSTPTKSSPPRPAGTTAATPPAAKQKTTTRPVVAARPVLTSITATRGRCWLLVRDGGPTGPVLYVGILEQGQAKRFRFTTKLWMRMGRPDALDITVAGKAIDKTLPASPANLVLTPSGAA